MFERIGILGFLLQGFCCSHEQPNTTRRSKYSLLISDFVSNMSATPLRVLGAQMQVQLTPRPHASRPLLLIGEMRGFVCKVRFTVRLSSYGCVFGDCPAMLSIYYRPSLIVREHDSTKGCKCDVRVDLMPCR